MSTTVFMPLTPAVRARLEQAVESLIALLDEMDVAHHETRCTFQVGMANDPFRRVGVLTHGVKRSTG